MPGWTFSPSAGPSQAGGSVAPTVTLGGPINIGSSASNATGLGLVWWLIIGAAGWYVWKHRK